MMNMSLEVIDPMNRTGKITVPLSCVIESRGIAEVFANRDALRTKDLSLCLLFQSGRCNAGTRCHQIHVDPQYIQKLRLQAAAGSACCAAHGDQASSGFLNSRIQVALSAPTAVFSLADFGRTSALDMLLRASGTAPTSEPIRLQRSRICRLHLQGRCKFGRDCKNIHLCPKASGNHLSESALMKFAAPVITAQPVIAAASTVDHTAWSSLRCHSSVASPVPSSPAESSVNSVGEDSSFQLDCKLLEASLSLHVTSPVALRVNGFEQILSAVCNDLANMHCSPTNSPHLVA